MKARHVKELRKKISNYKKFTVVTSGGLFGEFYDYYAKDIIFADNPYHAIQRYLRWWQRKYKRKHKFHKNYYAETTHYWGIFEVIDEKGYKAYWM